MNKRKYKKKHFDYLSRLQLKTLVSWCNLYRRHLKNINCYPLIDKMYIQYWKRIIQNH